MTHIGVVLVTVLTTMLAGAAPVRAAPDRLGPVPLPTTITDVTYPSGKFKARSDAGSVVGTVVGGSQREVWLQAESSRGWVTVDVVATDAAGLFSIPAPTYWVNEIVMRVHVPATDDHQSATSSQTGKITVVRTFKPRKGRQFARMSTRARWNPCHEITYKVNPRSMPRKGLRDVKEAFKRVAEGSGLRFRYTGKTSYVGWKDGEFTPIDGAHIGVAWTTADVVPALAGSTVGYAGGSSSQGFYLKGAISLDSTAKLRPGFKAGSTGRTGTLLVHEIGHVVGLDHVSDERQLMSPRLTRLVGHPGRGDLRGMNAVGADSGCAEADQVPRATPHVIAVAD